jgi:phosphatidylserine/phosphatidylglycerophosphate/cardiolipin synthase-like enzyme
MRETMSFSRKAVGLPTLLLMSLTLPPAQGDLRHDLVDHINNAHSSVDLVVYEIRSNEISEALIEAKHRGVRIRVIVDSVHSPVATPQEKTLEDEGIAVKRVSGSGRKLLHDKFIVFDGTVASTPSYNRSAKSLRGEDNEEAAFTHEKNLIQKLKAQFDDFWTSSGQTEFQN